VDYDRFQIAIIDLAARGVRLTVANVVAELGLIPQRVEQMLDQMTREGRLDIEVDESQGFVVYHVRGLSLRRRVESPRDVTPAPRGALYHREYRNVFPLSVLPARKSVAFGALLGALFPGVGLAYAAPWSVVFAATLIVFVLGKFIGGVLLLGPLFWFVSMGVCSVLGGLYAFRFNQEGRRAPLLSESGPHRLPN